MSVLFLFVHHPSSIIVIRHSITSCRVVVCCCNSQIIIPYFIKATTRTLNFTDFCVQNPKRSVWGGGGIELEKKVILSRMSLFWSLFRFSSHSHTRNPTKHQSSNNNLKHHEKFFDSIKIALHLSRFLNL